MIPGRSAAVLPVLLVLGAAVGVLGAPGCGFWFLETRSAPVAAERRAPAFELPDHEGRPVSLEGLLETGPAVVVFYRGHW